MILSSTGQQIGRCVGAWTLRSSWFTTLSCWLTSHLFVSCFFLGLRIAHGVFLFILTFGISSIFLPSLNVYLEALAKDTTYTLTRYTGRSWVAICTCFESYCKLKSTQDKVLHGPTWPARNTAA
ncbi:hypothetical protein BX600DRAFT_14916 [Xylariales sp. PMI_506]|nr:hypothetical protein BX600DRAFT_14916 [Xylariales sp. PMI_506]